MAFTITDNVEKIGNMRRFDSVIERMYSIDNWFFKYTTLDTRGREWKPGRDVEMDKNKYLAGTVFFDSEPEKLFMSSVITNVFVDTTPPVFVSSDVQYMTFKSDRKCSFTIESDTMIDVCQLRIACGDEVLYYCSRKDEHVITENVHSISYAKNKTTYVLKFALAYANGKKGEETDQRELDNLNHRQLTITIWDIAGNKAEFKTERRWLDLNNPEVIKPLEIEFEKAEPETLILSKNVEGRLLVRVINPVQGLWELKPIVRLLPGSLGYIDESSYTYDPGSGILRFYVTHINTSGDVTLETWLDIDNTELVSVMKANSYATDSFGHFIFFEEGRKYKFDGYVPKYLEDTLYKDFVKFVENFLNTSQRGLTTGNYISTLEKISRIGDFMDPYKIETPLLSEFVKEFNIEITPNLTEFVYYLNHKR